MRRWLETDEKLLWICAEAGMGKSAYSASLVQYFRLQERLLGVFFCQYGQVSRNNSRHVIKSLAYQIATYLPESRPFIQKGVESIVNSVSVTYILII